MKSLIFVVGLTIFTAAYFLTNGSNHLQESDLRPLSLCALCLRKLQSIIRFDAAARYHRLQQFYRNVGFISEQDWVTRRLKKIEDFTHGQD
jgi:archaemetzincin